MRAPYFLRLAIGALSCALAAHFSSVTLAQSIDISLNVFYEDPADVDSGGTWEIVAKSTHSGIGLLSLRLDDINSTVQFEAPRGTVNGSNGAGFWITGNSPQGESRNIILAQAGIPPSNFDPGDEQSIFYGVGTTINGSPGTVGPAFNSLTNLQGEIPWAPFPPGDPLSDAPTWDVAALFATGTFADGVTPSFAPGTTGQVYTSLGTSTTFPVPVDAAINTFVRTNFDPSTGTGSGGDFNDDGVVDAADFVTWRKNDGSNNALPNDGGLGTPIGNAHYELWKANFGLSIPGSGGGSSDSLAAVPEPASSALFVLAFSLFAAGQRSRSQRCEASPFDVKRRGQPR